MKEIHGFKKGWGSFSSWGRIKKQKQKRDLSILVDVKTFLELPHHKKREYLLPDHRKTSLMNTLLPPYGYAYETYSSNNVANLDRWFKEITNKYCVEHYADVSKALVSSPGNFGVRVEGKSKSMYACILCKSSHFAKTFRMSLEEKPCWSDLAETKKNLFDNNKNLYNCGFYETLEEYRLHLELHMDSFHQSM